MNLLEGIYWLSVWVDSWLMDFSNAKCVVPRIKTRRDRNSYATCTMMRQLPTVADILMYLRVWMHASLKPRLKFAYSANRATAVAGGVKKTLMRLHIRLWSNFHDLLYPYRTFPFRLGGHNCKKRYPASGTRMKKPIQTFHLD